MSKYIPKKENKENNAEGQVKPKLSVKVVMNDTDQVYLNEYDAFQMISELKKQMAQVSQAVQGIMDAMSAATSDVNLASPNPEQGAAPRPGAITLPKLNKVSKDKLSGGEKFYGSDGAVKLES